MAAGSAALWPEWALEAGKTPFQSSQGMADDSCVSKPSESTTTGATQPALAQKSQANVGECCLVMLRGPQLGRRISIDEARLIIGRSSECNGAILDPSVSREHCQVEIREGYAFVRDLGSTNGTCLAGQVLPPDEDFLLQGGDLIQVGDCVLKYLEDGAVETKYHEQLYRSLVIDELTGVYNRRFAVELLEREISRCRRHERKLSVVMLDIDHFKAVNDRGGHAAGDRILKDVARCLQAQSRREACVSRYGGEEFLVVLPEADETGALLFAEHSRAAVEMLSPLIDGERIDVTVSAGIAEWRPSFRNVEDLIRAADARLYDAKDQGRNRVLA